MTKISVNNDYIKHFESILFRYDGSTYFISLLKNKEKLKGFLQELGWYRAGCYLGDNAVDIISNFATLFPEKISGYFTNNVELSNVSCSLIKYIQETNIQLVKDDVLSCIQGYIKSVDSIIIQLLNKRTSQENIHLLGFGLNDGFYEKTIKDFLLKSNLAKKVTLYGFDPVVDKSHDDIIMLNPHDLIKNTHPLFDIIIAKWVLHHIHPSERWNNFIQCINHVHALANIVIVEEGLFYKKKDNTTTHKAYDLIFSFVDVMVNAALHPAWINNAESDFYINYLTVEDVDELIDGSNTIQKFSSIYCGSDFFQQRVIFN